ncbi:hypothetical protein RZ532_01080 [Nitratireductor aquimarinus]|uniref:hypothetical protein n=1 Tax=Nitratireductor aquimarinus TaxID=889300 RepID=UPI002936A129|nr:hypothetical protein [Nitratireductor aquimarinus]MDV2964554.1 hypothetical protein [Nitratireductor aquimarinus]
MKTLKIDGKWSVEFDPDNNDGPVHVKRWKANMRDMHSALGAMRNAINEHVPMPSMESDLLEGPEPAVFAEKVATAVCAEIERLRAKLAEAEPKKIWLQDYMVPGLIARAEAAEKRLASAKEVIAPFADIGRNTSGGRRWINGTGYDYLCDWFDPLHLRAAAEWMEKGE